MKGRKIVTGIILLIFGVLFLGCGQPKIRGYVFMDDNANEAIDEGESVLGNMMFKVTLEGKEIAWDKTDSDGSYSIKAKQNGLYCIEIENLMQQQPIVNVAKFSSEKSTLSSKAVKAGEEKPATGAKAVTNAKAAEKYDETEDIDGDGVLNKNDSDMDGDGKLNTDDNCRTVSNFDQKNTDGDDFGDDCDECPETQNGDTDGDYYAEECEDDDESETQQQEKRESTSVEKKSCVDVTGGNETIDVFIKKRYTKEKLPELATLEVEAGVPFKFSLIYPESCIDFRPFSLPQEVRLGEWGEDGGDLPPMLDIGGPAFGSPSIMQNTVDVITDDALVELPIDMVADPSIVADKDVTITFKAKCPDNTDYDFSRKVKIKGRYPITVTSEMLTPTDQGFLQAATFDVRYTVKNLSKKRYDNIRFEVGLENRSINSWEGPGCVSKGNSVSCIFSLNGDSEQKFVFKFNMPNEVSIEHFHFETWSKIQVDTLDVEMRKLTDNIEFDYEAVIPDQPVP